MDYQAFLDGKTQLADRDGFAPTSVPDFLFPFQRALLTWAVERGRAAVLADCGLGKTPIELAWADNVHTETERPVLILAPLAVSFQFEAEAAKFGFDAAVSRDGRPVAPLTITNYDRLHLFDRDDYGGVVCDESSCLKAFDGTRRAMVTEFLRKQRYRLLGTATAAPNDYVELGTSSEALGHLGHTDMLTRFFINDQRSARAVRIWDGGQWRFKGHAEEPFWRWVASWARALRRPSDLGFDDDGFVLPPLEYRQHLVETSEVGDEGTLFDVPAVGMREERAELRRSVRERCELSAELLDGVKHGIAWCHLNDEGDLLERLIPGAVQVKGSDPMEVKEERLAAFTRGDVRVLVTKPRIGGWGLNWQHCHRMTYFPSHSFEEHYQAVRRCWRFGQTQPVTVDVVTTVGGTRALASLRRKSDQSDRLFDALVAHMRDAFPVDRQTFEREVEVPPWAKS